MRTLVGALVACVLAGCGGDGDSMHAVSGAIGGKAAEGVVVMMSSGSGEVRTTTDASGRFEFPAIPDGRYTITPLLTDFAFSPPRRSVIVSGFDVAGQDFTAFEIKSPSTGQASSAGD